MNYRVERRPRIGQRRPAEFKKARRRLGDPWKEGCRRPDLRAGPDSHLRQHARDGLAHRGAVRDIDAVERHREAVGITRFLQQRARARRVIGEAAVELRHIAVDQPREIRSGRRGLPAQDLADDGVDVDRLVDRAPDAQVLERVAPLDVGKLQRVAALVEAEILRSDVGRIGQLEPSLLLQTRDILKRRIDDEIDLTRKQCRHAGRVRLDDDKDGLVDITAPSPPCGIRHQHRRGVGLVAFQPIRSGAVGVAHRVRFLVGVVILRLGDCVRDAPGLAHHSDVDEFLGQYRVGRGEQKVHRQIVDLACRLNAAELEASL